MYLIGGLSGRQVVVSGIQKDFRRTIRNQNAIGEINNIRELAAAETPRDNVIALKQIIQVFPHANGRTSCEYDPSFQRRMLPVLLLIGGNFFFKTMFFLSECRHSQAAENNNDCYLSPVIKLLLVLPPKYLFLPGGV